MHILLLYNADLWQLSLSDCPVGYFRVSYLERVPSRYTSSVSFRSGTQESILPSRIDDHIRRQGVEESLIESPSYRIFLNNPLQLGFFWRVSLLVIFTGTGNYSVS